MTEIKKRMELACPHCGVNLHGGDALIVKRDGALWRVECPSCGAQSVDKARYLAEAPWYDRALVLRSDEEVGE